MLDGAADGLVSDPARCHFDPATLQCPAGTADSASCLTSAQVGAVKKLYGGVTTKNGKVLYPGFYPGGEMGWAANTVINKTTKSGVSSYDFWGNAFFHKADWPFRRSTSIRTSTAPRRSSLRSPTPPIPTSIRSAHSAIS